MISGASSDLPSYVLGLLFTQRRRCSLYGSDQALTPVQGGLDGPQLRNFSSCGTLHKAV